MSIYATNTDSFKIRAESNDSNDRFSVLITDHNDRPNALKTVPNAIKAIEQITKAVALDLINQMIHNGDIDRDQAELVAIDHGIERSQIERLFLEAEGVPALKVS